MTVVSSLPGREQAELTGKRLAALGLKYDVLIHSSMARATETAHIISKHLPGSGCSRVSESMSVSLNTVKVHRVLYHFIRAILVKENHQKFDF